jgi:hypothetical protein
MKEIGVAKLLKQWRVLINIDNRIGGILATPHRKKPCREYTAGVADKKRALPVGDSERRSLYPAKRHRARLQLRITVAKQDKSTVLRGLRCLDAIRLTLRLNEELLKDLLVLFREYALLGHSPTDGYEKKHRPKHYAHLRDHVRHLFDLIHVSPGNRRVDL